MNGASRIASLVFLCFALLPPSSGLHAQSGSRPSSTQSSTTARAKRSQAPSPEEIADARSKGLVWVNLSTRVYHKEGPLYGATKRGKFMTEEDAKKAGYRLAQENGPSKKTSTSSTPK